MRRFHAYTLIEATIVLLIVIVAASAILKYFSYMRSFNESQAVINHVLAISEGFKEFNDGRVDMVNDAESVSSSVGFPSSLTVVNDASGGYFEDSEGRRYNAAPFNFRATTGFPNLSNARQGYSIRVTNVTTGLCNMILENSIDKFKAFKTNFKVVKNGQNFYGTNDACSANNVTTLRYLFY